jgi:hypothetical protein
MEMLDYSAEFSGAQVGVMDTAVPAHTNDVHFRFGRKHVIIPACLLHPAPRKLSAWFPTR